MKKILIVLAVLFVINLGCKKMDEDNGGGICACSPVSKVAYLNLVVKNVAGDDLLNPAITGSFGKDQIQLYSKDANGVEKQINFSIRTALTIGNEKFNYRQLVSPEIAILAKSVDQTFYLKLGAKIYEINLLVNNSAVKVEKVLIDKKEAPKETGKLITDSDLHIFYLNI